MIWLPVVFDVPHIHGHQYKAVVVYCLCRFYPVTPESLRFDNPVLGGYMAVVIDVDPGLPRAGYPDAR